ncbi:MAG: hypothetical protein IT320_16930 [Anaerolineae bacterium]|nr:hypothetical protein [Anaerolineae bacterium]
MNSRTSERGRQAIAVAIIATGLVFLISNVFNIDLFVFEGGWPFFVILPGLFMLAIAVSGDKRAASLVFPGTIVTGTGLILFVQNLTNYWESWAYVWALYPVFVGLALIYYGSRTDNANSVKSGRNLVVIGVALLAAFGTFFELILFRGVDGRTVNVVIAGFMILGGGFMLWRARNARHELPYTAPAKRKNNGDGDTELKRKIEEALAE